MDLLNENEYITIDGRGYANPQVALDESNQFIENLRSTQQQNTAQIAKDTAALGTDVSSNLGGLGGTTDYWTARYSTPQTNAAVANLRSTAQAAALNQVLQNEQDMWKKRYNDAYRAYQKRSWDKTNNPQNPSTTDPDNISTGDTTQEITSIETEALANSRYQKLLMKYLQAGYPVSEAETRAKEDFGKSIDVDAPVEPYGGQ